MVIVNNNNKCSSIILFLLSPSARPQFSFSYLPLLAHLCGCFWNNVYESPSLRHYKTEQDHPLIIEMYSTPYLFCFLNCYCSLSAKHAVYLHWQSHQFWHFKLVSIYSKGAKESLHMFPFLYREGCYSTKVNQVNFSEVILS